MSPRRPVDLVALLSPHSRVELQRRCEGIGIQVERAVRVPWLREWLETAAILDQADVLRRTTGCGKTAARQRAASLAGLNYSTFYGRLARARRAALDPRNDPSRMLDIGKRECVTLTLTSRRPT